MHRTNAVSLEFVSVLRTAQMCRRIRENWDSQRNTSECPCELNQPQRQHCTNSARQRIPRLGLFGALFLLPNELLRGMDSGNNHRQALLEDLSSRLDKHPVIPPPS